MPEAGPPKTPEASPDDLRLVRAIRAPSVKHQATELVRLALAALADLRRLDDSLYDQFVATRAAPTSDAANGASLSRLWDETFRGLVALLDHCRALVAAAPRAADPAASEADLDDLDFGEEQPAAPRRSDDFDLGASDIGTLLDGIGWLQEQDGADDKQRWGKVAAQIEPLEYGLRSQLADAAERRDVALAADKPRQVLGILDDAQSAASQGVHAIVAAVYATFVPEADPEHLVPGYLTSLGRALLVRRGLAELRAQVEPLNAELQGPDGTRHAATLDRIRETLNRFVASATCRAMRPADRWQMVQFQQQLAAELFPRSRQTCEGLAKYLESLATVNQREVLIVHDRRKLDEMRELLADARQLLDVSPRTAAEMLGKALDAARALRGRNPVFDGLLEQIAAAAHDRAASGPDVVWLERLEQLHTAAGS